MTSTTISVPGYTGPDRRRRLHISDSQFDNLLSDSDRLRGIDAQLSHVHERLAAGDQRMTRLQAELSANTEATVATSGSVQRIGDDTAEIRELMQTGRALFRFAEGFGRVARFCGGVAAAGMAIWGAIYAASHGKPPGG